MVPDDGASFGEALRLLATLPTDADAAYLPWDDLRFRTPPPGSTVETWWFALRLRRQAMQRAVPVRDRHGRAFSVGMPDAVLRLLHSVDRDCSGRVELPEDVMNPGTRDRYIASSLIEEAITSSQLEGASTTRRVAKEMLESRRAPRTHDERMIWNNHHAMEWVRANRDRALSRDAVLELHRIVTAEALDGGNDGAGRFRRADEDVVVVDRDRDEVVHVPPAAAELDLRMDALCTFANAPEDGETFLHPVVRSILVHFWLAHDHPFVDGNGRTARALFYWSLLHRGYWLAEFLSISRILRKAPAAYARAFQLSEDVDRDATFFLLHQLHVLRHAADDLFAYVKRKARELREVELRLRERDDLNHRQLAVLARLMRHPLEVWTVQRHRTAHAVAYDTARNDLLALARKGFLVEEKRGKAFSFSAPPDLERRLGKR
jgi:Fic family protein